MNSGKEKLSMDPGDINFWKKRNEELEREIAQKTTDLEQKNRELLIEASLDRVLAVALSIRKPGELLKVCEVVFNELNNDTSNKFSQLYNLNASRVSNIKLSYLSIPLILNYNVTKMVSLQAGPQFGILLDQHKDLLQNGKVAFKQGDFSMVGGLQVKLSSLRVYARYVVGLNNINEINNQDKWKNQSIQLGIGLSIL